MSESDQGLTMLSLASRQVWPQILGVVEFKPRRLILLHSSHKEESEEPARRLVDFFCQAGLLKSDEMALEEISHNQFVLIQEQLEEVSRRHALDTTRCMLNFTGGNKLMATAAFRWAERRWVKAFYLERGRELTEFNMEHGGVMTGKPRILDGAKTDALDAVELLKCQLGAAKVASANERLTLSPRGKTLHSGQLQKMIKDAARVSRSKVDFREHLDGYDKNEIMMAGSNLEYASAVMILKAGVRAVYRSVELKSSTMQGTKLEGELDLIFNWNGKLWVVDCKDRASVSDKLNGIETEMAKMGMPSEKLRKQIDALRKELEDRDIKVLREDLAHIAETGGILGTTLCVRSSKLPSQAEEYARSRRLNIVYKDDLESRLAALLKA